MSTAGGVATAPARAALIESAVLQLFTRQPSRWAEPVLTAGDCATFRAACAEHDIAVTAAHDSYLINLASPDDVLYARSLEAFTAELRRCAALGVQLVVTHPGNATDDDMDAGIVRNAAALQAALGAVAGVTVLLETTAGTGRSLGHTFEQLAAIIDNLCEPVRARVGICLDTCHVWAAGYDIADDYDNVFARFDDVLGLDRLQLFHLNDSVGGLGSRRDRHAGIGEGTIGEAPFVRIMNDARLTSIPKVIETPKGDDHTASDRRNLGRLRGYRRPTRTPARRR